MKKSQLVHVYHLLFVFQKYFKRTSFVINIYTVILRQEKKSWENFKVKKTKSKKIYFTVKFFSKRKKSWVA